MLKQYIINGKQWQFEEGEQPEGAVELKAVKPPKKAGARLSGWPSMALVILRRPWVES